MDAPAFVAVDDQTWIQVSQIVSLRGTPEGTWIRDASGNLQLAPGVPVKDFLARMVSVR